MDNQNTLGVSFHRWSLHLSPLVLSCLEALSLGGGRLHAAEILREAVIREVHWSFRPAQDGELLESGTSSGSSGSLKLSRTFPAGAIFSSVDVTVDFSFPARLSLLCDEDAQTVRVAAPITVPGIAAAGSWVQAVDPPRYVYYRIAIDGWIYPVDPIAAEREGSGESSFTLANNWSGTTYTFLGGQEPQRYYGEDEDDIIPDLFVVKCEPGAAVTLAPVYDYLPIDDPGPTYRIGQVGISTPFASPGTKILVWATLLDEQGGLAPGGNATIKADFSGGEPITLSDGESTGLGAADGVYTGYLTAPSSSGEASVQAWLENQEPSKHYAFCELLPEPPRLLFLTDYPALYSEFMRTIDMPGNPPRTEPLTEDQDGNQVPDFFDLVESMFQSLKDLEFEGMLWDLHEQFPGIEPHDSPNRIDRSHQIHAHLVGLPEIVSSVNTLGILGDDAVIPHYRVPVTDPGILSRHSREWYLCLNSPIGQDATNHYIFSDIPYGTEAPPQLDVLPTPFAGVARVYGKSPGELLSALPSLQAPLHLDSDQSSGTSFICGDFPALTRRHIIPALKNLWRYWMPVADSDGIPLDEEGTYFDFLQKDVDWYPEQVVWGLENTEVAFFLAHANPADIATPGKADGGSGEPKYSAFSGGVDLYHDTTIPPGHIAVLTSCHTGVALDAGCNDLFHYNWPYQFLRKGTPVLAIPSLGIIVTEFPSAQVLFHLKFAEAVMKGRWMRCLSDVHRQAILDGHGHTEPRALNHFGAYSDILYGWPAQMIIRGGDPASSRRVSIQGALEHAPAPRSQIRAAEQLALGFRFDGFDVGTDPEGRLLIQTPNTGELSGTPFEPLLPVARRQLVFPAGTQVQAVRIVHQDWATLPVSGDLALVQPYAFGTFDDPISRPVYGEPAELGSPYPDSPLHFVVQDRGAQGVHLFIEVTPLRYDPLTKLIDALSEMEIAVDTEQTPADAAIAAAALTGAEPFSSLTTTATIGVAVDSASLRSAHLHWTARTPGNGILDEGLLELDLDRGANVLEITLDTAGWPTGPLQWSLGLVEDQFVVSTVNFDTPREGITSEALLLAPPSAPLPSDAEIEIRIWDEWGGSVTAPAPAFSFAVDGEAASGQVSQTSPGVYLCSVSIAGSTSSEVVVAITATDHRGYRATGQVSVPIEQTPDGPSVRITDIRLEQKDTLDITFTTDSHEWIPRLESAGSPLGPWTHVASAVSVPENPQLQHFLAAAEALPHAAFLRVVLYDEQAPDPGLIAYYPFSGSHEDASGAGLHGTPFGTVFTRDANMEPGRAVRLSGDGEYINLGSSPDLKPVEGITVHLWAACNDWTTPHRSTRWISCTETGGWNMGTETEARAVQANLRRGSSYGLASYPLDQLSPGWHQFALTYDGQWLRLYVDGALVDSNDAASPQEIRYSAANSLLIGAEAGSGDNPAGYYFDGVLDEVRIYDRALDAAELQHLLPAQPEPSDLLAYFPMTGDASDATGNGFDGLPTNAEMTEDAYGNTDCAIRLTSGHIDIGPSADLKPVNAMSLHLWALQDDWANVPRAQKLFSNTESAGWNIEVLRNPTRVEAELRRSGIYGTIRSEALELGPGWHQFVLTYDGQSMRLFVDAVLVGEDDAGALFPIQYHWSNHAFIGAEAGSSANPAGDYYTGGIDEVRIYSRSLTEAEIHELLPPGR